MAKKDFKKGMDGLLGKKVNTSQLDKKKVKKSTLKTATYRYKVEDLEAIKDVAYWEREKIQNVLHEFIETGLKAYRRKNGEIKPRPTED